MFSIYFYKNKHLLTFSLNLITVFLQQKLVSYSVTTLFTNFSKVFFICTFIAVKYGD